jgi:hypothetical protein
VNWAEWQANVAELLANGTEPEDVEGWFTTEQLEDFMTAYAVHLKAKGLDAQ